MSERDGYPQGAPSWTDLATSDVEAGRAFYADLFGWEWDVNPDPQFGGYSQAMLRGRRVAALAGRMDDNQPVAWTTYLAADDADKVAAAVTEHGGSVLFPVTDIGDFGRMTLATDPTGAVFGVWQSGSHTGAQLVNEPGTVVWHELVTPDLDRATAFYSATLGVGWGDMDTGDPAMPYKLLQVSGRTAGGAMSIMPGMGAGPPHWTVYFEVRDAAATAARAKERGGQALTDVIETPQGPMVTLADPQGGVFAVITSGSTE
jgi:predicted enzyme related to lactoylglutathione lyase